jgi:hypothetical protein
MENDLFVRALRTVPDNALALSFRRYSGPAGETCPDWHELTSLALHAGLIEYLSPEYRKFLCGIGGRSARMIREREKYSEVELRDAEELVQALAAEGGVLLSEPVKETA